MAMISQTGNNKLKNSMGYDEVPTKDDIEDGGGSAKKEMKKATKILHHFKPLVFLLLLLLYSILGGWIFYSIEYQTSLKMFEEDAIKNKKLESDTIEWIYNLLNFDEFSSANGNETNFTCITNSSINLNITSLLPYHELANTLKIYSDKIVHQDPRKDWSFLRSVFYAGTVYTTIGYGNIIPHTATGRVVTIFYAIFGIPVMLFTLAQIGKMFCSGLLHLYLYASYFCCRCVRRNPKKKLDMVADFPLSLAFAVTFGWMCMCSGLFCAWEEWNFFQSFYFFFQSLTTIGLGDITPVHTKHMLSSFLLIVGGMSLVSMCLNLIQLKLERFINEMIEKIKNHYLQMELSEDKMSKDRESVISQIGKIANAQSVFLSSVMTDTAKERLVGEWQKKAALCNVGVQATVKMKEAYADYHPDMKSQSTQCLQPVTSYHNGGGGNSSNSSSGLCSSASPSKSLEVPLREIRHRSSVGASDEFRMKLKELGFILNECNSLVNERSHSSSK